jgi:hypothetical protein
MAKKFCIKCGYDYYVSRFCKVADWNYLCPHCRTETKNAHTENGAGSVTSTRLGKRK